LVKDGILGKGWAFEELASRIFGKGFP